MKFIHTNASVDKNAFNKLSKVLKPYISHVQDVINKNNYDDAESSINLPSDAQILKDVIAMRNKKVTSKLKYFIDIGIGGSNLGTKAVYDAFFGFYDVLQPNRFPKMIFLDTNDEEVLTKTVELIKTLTDKEEVLVNAISKSGGTTETISNLEVTLQALKEKFGDVYDRVVITTEEGSKFYNAAKEKNIDTLSLPKQVGGRYSIFSTVGMFPLVCCGIDIEALRQGALQMREQCSNPNIMENPAAVSAMVLYHHYKNGKNINDNFFFLPQLESVGKWYRQLMGESIGKEHDIEGNTVHAGITPTVSIGSTDLHSVGQLYLGGPKDKITTFLFAEGQKNKVELPQPLEFPLVSSIEGKSTHTIMSAIFGGVKIAYKNQQQPFMEILLNTVSENDLGAFLQFKMIEMMYLGKLMRVNPFDQPHVELYKIETKKILEQT